MRLLEQRQPPHRTAALPVHVEDVERRDTIFFDGACGMCSTSAKRLQRIVAPRGFALQAFQADPSFQEVPDEMKLRTRDGTIFGGADAIVYVARRIWWAWPLWAVSLVPGMMRVLRFVYRIVAKNRYRISGACRIDR